MRRFSPDANVPGAHALTPTIGFKKLLGNPEKGDGPHAPAGPRDSTRDTWQRRLTPPARGA